MMHNYFNPLGRHGRRRWGACRLWPDQRTYTTARAHLRKHKPATAASPAPADYARLAGRSDAILKEKTGCGWERWVKALDQAKAYTWSHPEIAKHVREKYTVPSWWAQTVTVGYERIKGLRAVGQRRDASPLAAGRRADGSDCHTGQVDADHLAGPDVGRGVFHPRGSRKEPGRRPAREAAGSSGGNPGEGVLDRAAGRVGGRVGAQVDAAPGRPSPKERELRESIAVSDPTTYWRQPRRCA